jgi:Tfp pilus assembly protein PilX
VHLLRSIRARLAAEDGFTMLLVMITLTVSSLVAVAAYQATSGDARPARYDQSTKSAYAAAQAGLSWYVAELSQDPSYWAKCTGVDRIKINGSFAQAPVWDGMAASARPWRIVADGVNTDTVTTSVATIPTFAQAYSVELLPAPGQTKCVPDNDASMIDTYGTFRVRVTGRVGPDVSGQRTPQRAIIATFRRKGFLDYLWYAQYEEVDPQLAAVAQGVPFGCTAGVVKCPMGDYATWAQTNCTDKYWWGATGRRTLTPWRGDMSVSDNGPNVTAASALLCPDAGFRSGDAINGSVHVSDTLLICSNPSFGFTAGDKIETEDPGDVTLPNDQNGWRNANHASEYNGVPVSRWGCANPSPNGPAGSLAAAPQWLPSGNALVKGAAPITPPADNDSLASAASAGYSFIGKTVIKFGLTAGKMNVCNSSMGLSNKQMNIPTNGVIYVANGAACTPYNPKDTDASSDTCGDARVEGTINTSLTIGAQNDIVITADLRAGNLATNLIGLVAQNYVRVHHPVGTPTAPWDGAHSAAAAYASNGSCSTANSSGTYGGKAYPLGSVIVDAAILTLKHSFMVDNWRCGAALGTLTVNGAIAQKYHGPISTTAPSGYTKAFSYNTALKYRSPPAFLAPVQAAWRLVQVQEQAGAGSIVGS